MFIPNFAVTILIQFYIIHRERAYCESLIEYEFKIISQSLINKGNVQLVELKCSSYTR